MLAGLGDWDGQGGSEKGDWKRGRWSEAGRRGIPGSVLSITVEARDRCGGLPS